MTVTPSRPSTDSAFTTSMYRGSPMEPGSLVRSSTAIFFTVSGRAATNFSVTKGRYKRTFTRPTFSPWAVR